MAGEGAERLKRSLEMRGGGVLTVEQDGPRVRLAAERPDDGKGLYKVWLRGERGGRLLLGTLAPENGALRLSRTLSLDELERAGCWSAFWAETVLAFSFSKRDSGAWYCEREPARLLADPLLKRQVHGSMLCRRDGADFCLAEPFRTDRPVALEGIICLARLERWPDRPHLVWEFDGKGRPKIPYSGGKSG